jgi:hypothetical protein
MYINEISSHSGEKFRARFPTIGSMDSDPTELELAPAKFYRHTIALLNRGDDARMENTR